MGNIKEVFTKLTLSDGSDVEILQCKGFDYFMSMYESNGNAILAIKNLCQRLVFKKGKKITLEELDEMYAVDIVNITEVISLMITSVNQEKI